MSNIQEVKNSMSGFASGLRIASIMTVVYSFIEVGLRCHHGASIAMPCWVLGIAVLGYVTSELIVCFGLWTVLVLAWMFMPYDMQVKIAGESYNLCIVTGKAILGMMLAGMAFGCRYWFNLSGNGSMVFLGLGVIGMVVAAWFAFGMLAMLWNADEVREIE